MLLRAPLSPMCTPSLAQQLRSPADLAQHTLLRSYRTQEWEGWFTALAQPAPLARGAMFDSSLTLAEAAAQGAGVALLPTRMFGHMLQQGRLVRPFAHEVDTGAYWLTHLKSRSDSAALQTFRQWLLSRLQSDAVAENPIKTRKIP